MSDLVHVTTHADDAVNALIGQYQERPRIEAVLRALVKQFQDIEDATWDVYVQSALDAAVDNEQDMIGDIVGQKRQGASNDEYRVFLAARIKANRSDGKYAQLVVIAKLLLGDATRVGYREFYPSAIEMASDGVAVNPFIVWRDFLHRAKGAAKRLNFVYSLAPSATTLKRGSFYGLKTAHALSQMPGSVYAASSGVTAGVFG